MALMPSQGFNSGGIAQVVLEIKPTASDRPHQPTLIYGYINTSGKVILKDGQYDAIVSPFKDQGYAVVRKNGREGLLDKDGRELGWYQSAKPFGSVALAPVKVNGRWGYVNKEGELLVAPRFDGAWTFGESKLAIVLLKGKYGHIDQTGGFVTEPLYDKLGHFAQDDLAPATLGGVEGYISRRGSFKSLKQ